MRVQQSALAQLAAVAPDQFAAQGGKNRLLEVQVLLGRAILRIAESEVAGVANTVDAMRSRLHMLSDRSYELEIKAKPGTPLSPDEALEQAVIREQRELLDERLYLLTDGAE